MSMALEQPPVEGCPRIVREAPTLHRPERASGPPYNTEPGAGCPKRAIYRKASAFTSSLTNQSMLREQFLGVG